MPEQTSGGPLPGRGGVSLKPVHYGTILTDRPDIGFLEVHAENYMGAGGPPHRYLTAIREYYPLSIHGVGLSIGGAGPIDRSHLDRLERLVARYQPEAVSEHLAWSSHEGAFLDDLLPLPYTNETLRLVCEHVDEVQMALGRPILIENPATYVRYGESTWDEPQFIRELVARTGCGLLLDVNNIHVSCTNHDHDPHGYFADLPLEHVGEIHLAGFATRRDASGHPLLIDSHDRAVDEVVWALYAEALALTGPVATLIERDADIPEWGVLAAEAARADLMLIATSRTEVRHAVIA